MAESDREQGCPAQSPTDSHCHVLSCHSRRRLGGGRGQATHQKSLFMESIQGPLPCTALSKPQDRLALHQDLKDTNIQKVPVQLVPSTCSQQRPSCNWARTLASEGSTWFRKETGLQQRGPVLGREPGSVLPSRDLAGSELWVPWWPDGVLTHLSHRRVREATHGQGLPHRFSADLQPRGGELPETPSGNSARPHFCEVTPRSQQALSLSWHLATS